MKSFFTILLFFCFSVVKPQAADWTKTDCSGNSQRLYSYLDSNKVVAMIFGMGCSSCTDAVAFFASLKPRYAANYPGKYKAFYMDFWDGHTCGVNMINSGLDADFDSCSNELSVYTSATPMTFIVVAAGSSHDVIYSAKKNIFDYSDSVNIITAIDNYFSAVGIKKLSLEKSKISVYPNPFSDKIKLSNSSDESFSVMIYDLQGKLILECKDIEAKEKTIGLENVCAGEYFLKVKYRSGITETKKIIKN